MLEGLMGLRYPEDISVIGPSSQTNLKILNVLLSTEDI